MQGGNTAGAIGIDREFFESILLPAIVPLSFMGLRPTATTLHIEPRLPTAVPSITLRGLAYLALGATEYHGRHLPVGLDTLKAHALACRAAERTGGVVLPPLPLGSGGEHGPFPWTWMLPEAILFEILRVTLEGLERQGARVIVLLSGHYPNQPPSQEAARRHAAAGGQARVLCLVDYEAFTGEPDRHADHAGRWETALQLALHPETVDLQALACGPDGRAPEAFSSPRATEPGGWWFEKRADHPWHGIAMPEDARPDAANAVEGADAVERIVTWIVAQVHATLPDPPPHGLSSV